MEWKNLVSKLFSLAKLKAVANVKTSALDDEYKELSLIFSSKSKFMASKHWGPIDFFPRCWQRVSVALLLQICEFFWNLSKPAQDGLLWSIQALNGPRATGDDSSGSDSGSDLSDESSSNSRMQSQKTKWFLGEVRVCRRSFAKMLGIGQSRLQRTRHRFEGLDERTVAGHCPMW